MEDDRVLTTATRTSRHIILAVIFDLKIAIFVAIYGGQIYHRIFLITVLMHDVAKEVRQDSLIGRHLGIARKVVDVYNEVMVPDLDIPYHVEVEEVKAHCSPQAMRDPGDEAERGHLDEVDMHQLRSGGTALCRHVGHLGEGDGALGGGALDQALLGDVGEGAALDAGDVVADDVDLEDDPAVVDEFLEDKRGLQLAEAVAVEDERHLVGAGAAVGDEGLGDDREAEGPDPAVGEGGGVVDNDLAGDAEGLGAVVGSAGEVEVGHELEHGDAVAEALDGGGAVHDGDLGVARGELVELGPPLLAGELVEDAVEGALLRERARRVDRDEIDAAGPRELHERRLDEALPLLGGQSVPYREPSQSTAVLRRRRRHEQPPSATTNATKPSTTPPRSPPIPCNDD